MPSPTTSEASSTLPARLHHHAFVTTDQEATRRFYEDIVGLPLVATWTEVEHLMGGEEQEFCHTFYGLGDGGALAFFQFANSQFAEQFAPPPAPSLFRHLALLVAPEQQDAIRDRAEASGLETMMADHGYCRSLYIRDPNGLVLELTGDHTSNDDWRPNA